MDLQNIVNTIQWIAQDPRLPHRMIYLATIQIQEQRTKSKSEREWTDYRENVSWLRKCFMMTEG